MAELQGILTLLKSSDPDDIREGAYLAGQEKSEDSVPLLVEHVNSTNIGVQEAIERALGKIGGVVVLNAMLPLLSSDDSPVRNIAMDLLRKVASSDVETICNGLHDEDPDIRIFISDILGSSGSPLAIKPLCASLLRDPEVNVRYQAAISLGNLGVSDPEMERSLVQAMDDEEWVQFAVIDSLAKIHSEGSSEALSKHLGRSTDLVASMIVEALGIMGSIKAVPLLIRHLALSPTPLCNKIVKAIVSILGAPSLSLLGKQEGERLRGYMLAALQDEDTSVQDAAISGLAYIGGSDAFTAIFEIAQKINVEREHERVLSILETLAGMGYDPILESKISGKDEGAALTAVTVMSHIEDVRVTELFKKYFWKCSRDVQRGMISSLATNCSRKDEDFFLDVINRHSDGSVLKSALIFLGRKADPAKVTPAVIKLLDHDYPDVKEIALEACVALNVPVVNEKFRDMFSSSELMDRMMAVYGMGHYSIEENEDLLLKALSDIEPDIRKLGIESLGSTCPIPGSYIGKIESLLSDSTREVRMAVIDAFGNCMDEALTSHLIRCLDDPDPWIRARCIEYLGTKARPGMEEHIVNLLQDSNQLVVIKAIEALANIGGEVAFRALLPFVDHAEPEVQRVVQDAVAKIRQEAGEI